MAKLLSKTPLGGRESNAGALRLAEIDLGSLLWIAPYPGAQAAVSEALEAACGVGFPAPGEALETDNARILWSGREQAILIGAKDVSAEIAEVAAIVDLSDGWAAMCLEGPKAADVLARLCPIDLRASVFGPGQTARNLLGHMNAQITPRGDGFEILVMRSMAETAFHEIEEAMHSVAARETT